MPNGSENPCVAGSIPVLATSVGALYVLLLFSLAGENGMPTELVISLNHPKQIFKNILEDLFWSVGSVEFTAIENRGLSAEEWRRLRQHHIIGEFPDCKYFFNDYYKFAWRFGFKYCIIFPLRCSDGWMGIRLKKGSFMWDIL